MEEYKGDTTFFDFSYQRKLMLETAQESFCEQVAKDFPVGMKIIVELGGHQLKTIVKHHNDLYWCGAGEFYVENINTGKERKVTIGDVVCKCNDSWERCTE